MLKGVCSVIRGRLCYTPTLYDYVLKLEGGIAIPVTPDVAPIEKKRPRRSVKAKPEIPENPPDSPVEVPASPEGTPAAAPRGPGEGRTPAPPRATYEWDRTIEENEQRQRDLITSRTPFPVPSARTLAFPAFCAYWNELIKQPVAKYARLYVHRWFPVLLPDEFEDKHGMKREVFPTEKQFTAELGPLDENRLLTEVGVGDYTFRLNDSRRAFNDRTIVFGEKLATMRNWDLYPPVFNVARLDWADDSNQVYIKWAQSRGRLQQGEHEKDKADMASDQVVTQLLEQNKTLTDKVINSKAPESPQQVPVKAETNGDGAIKAVVDFASKALDRPAAAAEATDPMKLVTGMVDLVKAITPTPDKTAAQLAEKVVEQAEAANTRIYELQKQGMQDLRAELDRLRAAPITAPVPLTRRQMLEDLSAEQTLLGQLGAGKNRRNIDEEEERPSNMDKWLDVLPLITPVASSFIQGLFGLVQFGFQAWQTNHYNDAIARQNGAQPKPPMTDKPPEPGQPMAPEAPKLTPEQQAQQQQFSAILQGVAKLIGPLQRALQNSKTGAEFAGMVIEFTDEGRNDYDRIRNVAESLTRLGMQVQGKTGVEQFKNAVAYLINTANPAFYAKIATVPTFGDFLEEFYDFDRIMAQEEANRQAQGAQP